MIKSSDDPEIFLRKVKSLLREGNDLEEIKKMI